MYEVKKKEKETDRYLNPFLITKARRMALVQNSSRE